jgi:hypothetical protein
MQRREFPIALITESPHGRNIAPMSALPRIADINGNILDVRFVP